MGITTTLDNQSKRVGSVKAAVAKADVNEELLIAGRSIKSIGIEIYNEIQETVKSVLVILAVMALFKTAGLYELWIQLVDRVS